MISPDTFFHFFKVLVFQVVSGVKGQEMAHNDQFQSDTLNIWRAVDHINKIFGTQV